MLNLNKIKEFEWDSGNLDKSYKKHGITPKEAEESFLDEHLLLLNDSKHSKSEKRFIALGRTTEDKLLFAAFTIRNNKIRIISVRLANKKERREYEKI